MKMSSICMVYLCYNRYFDFNSLYFSGFYGQSYVAKLTERLGQVRSRCCCERDLIRAWQWFSLTIIKLVFLLSYTGLSTQRCTETYSKATGAYVVHHSPRYVQYRTSYPTSLHVMSDDVMCVWSDWSSDNRMLQSNCGAYELLYAYCLISI